MPLEATPHGDTAPYAPYKATISHNKGKETYLITSKGGGGHESAADAVQYNLVKGATACGDRKKCVVNRVDILRNTIIPNFLADKATGAWDEAKKSGDVKKQIQLVKGKFLGIITYRTLADCIFFTPIFLKTFFTLLGNKKITQIIDTQPIGTSSVIKATRLVNFLFRRHIIIMRVMTDLPTNQAIHFSASAKKLSKSDKKIFTLISTFPFPKFDTETSDQYIDRMDAFWKEEFGLSLKAGQVKYGDFPLRPAFKNENTSANAQNLGIKLNNDDERSLLESINIFNRDKVVKKDGESFDRNTGSIKSVTYNYAPYQVKENDTVGFITIGSQANAAATKAYIEDVIELTNKYNKINTENPSKDDKEFHLFVAAGRHIPGKNTLFKEIVTLVKEKQTKGEFSHNLKVIPMGFQGDAEFAPIMRRANFGIYGAGGLTTMESNSVASGRIMIHSDAKGANAEMSEKEIDDRLLEGFVLWEQGNAKYQLATKGKEAKLVAPQKIFKKRVSDLFFGDEAKAEKEEARIAV